jgi:hypothetical protein
MPVSLFEFKICDLDWVFSYFISNI